jgi:serine beta-lactamase-like protein LACTB, mitochondrial
MSLVLSNGTRARALLALCLLLCHAPRAFAQTTVQRQGIPADKLREIDALIVAEKERQKIPGLSVALVTDRQPQWSNGYGLSDVENEVAAKPATVYRLGSISKPITATAVMQLAERGKLDLDAPVQTYCSTFPRKPWPITTRQVLAHLSGIRHYKQGAAGREEFNSTRHYDSITESLAVFKDDPLKYEPGTTFLYSTFGYTVLGCEVEGATHMNFADYVRENVLAPAGMEHTRVDSITDLIPNRAQGYVLKAGALNNSALTDNSYKVPGGGFVSTVEDLAKFAAAVETYKLLKRETTEQMFTRQRTRGGEETPRGLCWLVGNYKGRRAISHGGDQQRVKALLYMQPDQGVAVVLMANLEDVDLYGLAQQITDVLLR